MEALRIRGVRICYWTTPRRFGITNRHSEGILKLRFPRKYVNNPPNSTYCQASAAPSQEELKVSAQWGKTRVFCYKPMICWKNPGFSPKSRVNPGFAFEPEKFLGFRRLGYIYISMLDLPTVHMIPRVTQDSPSARLSPSRTSRRRWRLGGWDIHSDTGVWGWMHGWMDGYGDLM